MEDLNVCRQVEAALIDKDLIDEYIQMLTNVVGDNATIFELIHATSEQKSRAAAMTTLLFLGKAS